MKLFISFCLVCVFFLNPSVGFSQNENRKEVELSGIKYVLHTVAKSETVYSICQKYKVTQSELQQANPGLTTILQAGSTIKIPVTKIAAQPQKEEIKTKPAPAEEFYYHKVKKKQTIFSIARQYGITDNDLIRYNPDLANGLQIGQILKIPAHIKIPEGQAVNEALTIPSGQDYTLHLVVSGETVFSLEQRYGITHEEMMKNNPSLQSGLKAGMKLRIPVKTDSHPVEPAIAKPTFTKYKVERGETLFSLSTRFGVEVTELKKANPALLSRSLESGETIMIPQYPSVKSSVAGEQKPNATQFAGDPASVNCIPVSGVNTRKYRAALLLPFHLPGNDQIDPVNMNKALLMSKISLNSQYISTSTDTSSVFNISSIDQKTEDFVEFYEGALLAIDSLQRKGMNIELYVFDVSNQQMINALLQLNEFRDLDLIIGPVYPELQGTVASFAAKNRIPMISPLSSSGNYEQNNSWYFKAIPTRESQIEQTASYVAGEFPNKNLFFLQNGNSSSDEAKIARLSKEKLAYVAGNNLFHEYSFLRQGVNALKPLLNTNGENIFIIPTDNEAQVSVAVTNLTALAEHYDIVLMGTPALSKLKSIQTENYHRIRLRYLSPYFIDYKKPLVRRFISQYREVFSNEPSQFSFQGFDVSYYFLSALYRYGKDFRSCLPDYPMELTQVIFNFRKVAPMGGFMNQGMFVTAWERNFDVKNYGVVGSDKETYTREGIQ